MNSAKDGIETGTLSRRQDWTLDALGNWDSVTTDTTTQDRSHNKQNQITTQSVAYDSAGNMTTDDGGSTLVYDAWGRVVRAGPSSGAVTYSYDGLNRRMSGTVGSVVTSFVYSNRWQVIQEYEDGVATKRNAFSPVYVDAMILRQRDMNDDPEDGFEEQLFVMQDANLINVWGNFGANRSLETVQSQFRTSSNSVHIRRNDK